MEASEFLSCNHCAHRIGVYEPLWWRRPDGTVDRSSFLQLRDDPERHDPQSEFFHEACLAEAARV